MFSFLYFLLLPQLVFGFSFELTSAPTQCGQLNLNITQGTGTPPYSVLVVPFGASPTNPEQRKVFSHNFTGTSTNFQMPYPGNSGFVITVGDAHGIGTGGTSIPTGVQASSDASCLPSKVSTQFSFQILPNNAINQCQNVVLAWNSQVQGDVNVQLVIPGGQSSTIPRAQVISGFPGNTSGFNWVPNIPVGTSILLVSGDSRGIGTGGSAAFSVGNNPTGDSSCLNDNSPSSTPGTAAGAVETGGSSPSPSPTTTNTNTRSSSTNVGAIVGGVIAGIAAVIIAVLLTLFFVRRRRHQKQRRRHSLDLLPETGGQTNELYHPEPFIVPSVTAAGAGGTSSSRHARTASELSEEDDGLSAARPSMSEAGRRYSALSTTDASETTGPGGSAAGGLRAGTGTGTMTSMSRKSPIPPPLRAVNYVQHEDAGQISEVDGEEGHEPETVELPPNYDAIRGR